MSRPPEQSFRIDRKGFNWNKEFEYCADSKKLKRWMKSHGYSRKAMVEIAGIGFDKARYIYAKGNFTLYEAKKLAVGVGMSLYDFIDIFLSDIYPVTPGDFDILSDEDENETV